MRKLIYPFLTCFFFFSVCAGQGPKKSLSRCVFKLQSRGMNYPVLKNKETNPAFRIVVMSAKELATVNAVAVNISRKSKCGLKTMTVFYTGADSTFSDRNYFGEAKVQDKKVSISGNQSIKKGMNYFWVAYKLSENGDINEKLESAPDFIRIDGNRYFFPENGAFYTHRLGLAVRKAGDDSIHTYRIPGLITTNKGTLLASYDVRHNSSRDLQGDIDIGLSRSFDGGNTWEPMQIVLDKGKWGGLPEKYNGVSDACILNDRRNNRVFIFGLWMHGVLSPENGKWIEGLTGQSQEWNHQWNNYGSQPGIDVRETSQIVVTESSDDGKTWSNPLNITSMCKNPAWWLLAPAPGRGIVMSDGTLVVPAEGRDEKGNFFSGIIHSKDHGVTWKNSNPACPDRITNECQVVELPGGELMLNMRDLANGEEKGTSNGRTVAVTHDLGQTWQKHLTSNHALPEPVCMASLYRHDFPDSNGKKQTILFFSNPNSKSVRNKMTIKASFDNGNTWPGKYWIELDEGTGNGYSCLSAIDNEHIGILYESSQAQLVFQSIPVKDFFSNKKQK